MTREIMTAASRKKRATLARKRVKPPNGATRNAERTEALIVATAQKLFARHGYDGVSTKLLASEAGLTIGALYHHFSGKQAVYEAATHRALASKSALPASLLETAGSPEQDLARLVTWFVRTVIADPDVGPLLQRELLDSRLDARTLIDEDHFREAFERFRQLIRRLLPSADLDEALASMLALIFGLSNMKGIATLAPGMRAVMSTPEEIGNRATALLLRGLRT